MSARGTATSVVLVVLAAGAAIYAIVIDRAKVSDDDRAARRDSVLPSLRIEDVTRLRLEHGGEALVLERGADRASWTMTSPHHEAADGASVDLLLRQLEQARRVRSVEGDAGLELASPRARGVLELGALTYRFTLGGDAPRPEGAAYLRVDGEGTFVIEHELAAQLLRGADAYRDRVVVPYGGGGIGRVEVHAATGDTFALDRNGATFRLAPQGLRASRAEVEHLLSALADARVSSFVDDAAADAATAHPAFTVSIAPREGTRPAVELKVGGACPASPDDVVLVRTAPSRLSACVPVAVADALAAPPGPDTSPFFAHADEVDEARLEPVGIGGPTVDIARRGTGWHERAPEDRELGADASGSADALVRALAEARGIVRPADAGAPFVPRARVTIVRTGTRTSEAVDIAESLPDGGALVRRADDGALLLLPRASARRFAPHPVALRGGPAWSTPFDAAAVVAIDNACASPRERLELVDHRWLSRSSGRREADAIAVTELAVAAAGATPSAWVAEADDGGFGLDGPGACTVALSLTSSTGDGGTRPRRVSITFGAPGQGGAYARTGDDPAIFVAPEALVHALAGRP